MNFPPSVTSIGLLLHKLYGFDKPFPIGQAVNAAYVEIDSALQHAGLVWQPDYEGIAGTYGQKIPAGIRLINQGSDPLLIVVLRAFRDGAIRSGTLRACIEGLITDAVWSLYERGFATRQATHWILLQPPTKDTAAQPQKVDTTHETTKSHRTRTRRNDKQPTATSEPKTRRARANNAESKSQDRTQR
jgi:hypothetical protein